MELSRENSKKGRDLIGDEGLCDVVCIKSMGTSLWQHFYGNQHSVRIVENLFGKK